MIGRFVRENRQIVAGAIMGLGSAIGGIASGLLIGGEVERGLELMPEDVQVSVQGFNSSISTDRLALAHNFGGESAALMSEVVIIVSDNDSGRTKRLPMNLNPGVIRENQANPFTVPGSEGRRYFLTVRPKLESWAAQCVLEFQVMQRDSKPRSGKSPPFKCIRLDS